MSGAARANAGHLPTDWLVPDWPAPSAVCAFVTTRAGGTSEGPWGLADGTTGGMNLGLGSGEPAERVLANRDVLMRWLPAPPAWLRQVHGCHVVRAPLAESRHRKEEGRGRSRPRPSPTRPAAAAYLSSRILMALPSPPRL